MIDLIITSQTELKKMIELEELQKNIEKQLSKIDKFISMLESLRDEKDFEKIYKVLCDFGNGNFLWVYRYFMF